MDLKWEWLKPVVPATNCCRSLCCRPLARNDRMSETEKSDVTTRCAVDLISDAHGRANVHRHQRRPEFSRSHHRARRRDSSRRRALAQCLQMRPLHQGADRWGFSRAVGRHRHGAIVTDRRLRDQPCLFRRTRARDLSVGLSPRPEGARIARPRVLTNSAVHRSSAGKMPVTWNGDPIVGISLAAHLDRFQGLEWAMQVYPAIKAASGPGNNLPRSSAPQTTNSQSLLLTESAQSLGGPPSLFEALSPSERETVLKRGRPKVLYRGQTLFNQGAKHDGIYLIETARIRVFYTAPSGREITLAYSHPPNLPCAPDASARSVP